MKFSKKTKSAIWQEARRKVGGFGMWLEVHIRYLDTEPIIRYTNRLRKEDDDSDLWDFVHWSDFCDYDFEMINGHTLLDVPVHDKEQLIDNLLCLINEKGELLQSWIICEACRPEMSEMCKQVLSQYEEK